MKATLTVLCAGLEFSWVAIAGAHAQPNRHAALQAQSGYGQSGYGQSGSEQSKSSKKSKEVKLTGCLQQGSNPDEFVLMNATKEGDMDLSKGTSGSSGGEQTGSSGMQSEHASMDVELVPASSRLDLKKHVGHRVEVSGTLEAKDEGGQSSTSSQGTSGEAGETARPQGTSPAQRLKVTSIKHLASSCQ